MKNLHDELMQMRIDLDLTQKAYCDKDETSKFKQMEKENMPLPVDVTKDESGDYFRYVDANLSEQEFNQLIMYRQVLYLRSIKNSMIFFVVLTLLSLFISLIAMSKI